MAAKTNTFQVALAQKDEKDLTRPTASAAGARAGIARQAGDDGGDETLQPDQEA